MNGELRIALGGAILLFLLLYFGFDRKSPQQAEEIAKRDLSGLSLNLTSLVEDARKRLGSESRVELDMLEANFQSSVDTQQIEWLKKLSGFWFKQREYYVSGSFAERVAELQEDGESWGIAGTTFLQGAAQGDEMRAKGCWSKAIETLENAISLDPDQINHRINLALAYVKRPPAENPMKGILMLRDLQDKNPDSVPVLYQLGRLAVETGQYERAWQRLEKAAQMEPENKKVVCLLSEIAQRLNNPEQSNWIERCKLLTI